MGLDLLVRAPTRRLTILWADDDPRYLRGEHRYLRRQGHAVISTVDFEETAHVLATRPFDLLILDQQMPRAGRKAIDAGTSLTAMLCDGELGDLNLHTPFLFWTASEAWVKEGGFDVDEIDQCLGIAEKGNYLIDALDEYVQEVCASMPDADSEDLEPEGGHPPATFEGDRLDKPQGPLPSGPVLEESWAGVVLAIGADTFHARLSAADSSLPDHEATLPLEFASPAEQDLIVEGARFTWTMAIEEDGSGERTSLSRVRFYAQPEISQADLDEAMRLAGDARERREEKLA